MSESLTRVLNGYADEVRRLSTAEAFIAGLTGRGETLAISMSQ